MVKVLMWLAVVALGMVGAPALLRAQTDAQFLEIEAAPFHACGRVGDGAVLCWGANDQGQLGSGRVRDRRFARRVHGILSPVTVIGVGESHSCAIAALGCMRCWGRKAEGQLGGHDNRLERADTGADALPGISAAQRLVFLKTASGSRRMMVITSRQMPRT